VNAVPADTADETGRFDAPRAFLAAFRHAGGSVVLHRDGLRIDGPRSAVTPAARAYMERHADELVCLLRREADAREVALFALLPPTPYAPARFQTRARVLALLEAEGHPADEADRALAALAFRGVVETHGEGDAAKYRLRHYKPLRLLERARGGKDTDQ
jgi:hypothetical protein